MIKPPLLDSCLTTSPPSHTLASPFIVACSRNTGMAWDAWVLVPRDVQLALMANLLGPIIYLQVPSFPVAALSTLLSVGIAALFADWAPASVVTSLFLCIPFLPWGLAEGYLISSANDHFLMPHTPLDQEAMDGGGDTSRFMPPPPAARLVALGLTVLLAVVHLVNVAVPQSALSYVNWITTVVTIVIFGALWFLHRGHAQMRMAWLTMGVVATAALFVVTMVVWLSDSFFWPLVTLIIYWPVAMISTYLSSVFTSHDVMNAARNIVSSSGPGHTLRSTGMPTEPMASVSSADTQFPSAAPMPAYYAASPPGAFV